MQNSLVKPEISDKQTYIRKIRMLEIVCIYRSWILGAIEEDMPKALRLHADPPGRRPRERSHLTLPSEELGSGTGEPTGRGVLPAWPAYKVMMEYLV